MPDRRDSTTIANTRGEETLVHPDGTPSGTERAEAPLEPASTAVVVVDVQRLFTDLLGVPVSPSLDEVLPRLREFVEQARDAGAQIVLVRTVIAPHEHSRSTLQWPEFMRAQLAPNSPGSEFDPCITRAVGDVEIIKQRYSAFHRTPLDATLRERGVSTVVVLGLTTNVCVQSTVRDAWQLDYQTITVSDCCSEVGAGSHETSLAWTRRNFGEVLSSDELISRLRVASAATA